MHIQFDMLNVNAQAISLLQNKQAENSGNNLVKYTGRGRRKMKMQNYEIKTQRTEEFLFWKLYLQEQV